MITDNITNIINLIGKYIKLIISDEFYKIYKYLNNIIIKEFIVNQKNYQLLLKLRKVIICDKLIRKLPI